MNAGDGVAPRAAARRVLAACLRRGGFATRYLPGAVRGLEPRDADLARELALGTLRHLSRLDHVLASAASRPLGEMAPDLLDVLRIALFQVMFLDRIPPHAAVSVAVDEARAVRGEGGARLANGLLRGLLRRGRLDEVLPPAEPQGRRLAVEFSLPEPWVERQLARIGGDALRAAGRAMGHPPDVDLLVRRGRISVAELAQRLASDGIAALELPAVPGALRLPGTTRPPEAILAEGLAAVVDCGAQFVAAQVDPPTGGRVLDAAASPGGKSLALGVARPDLRVVSAEREPNRLPRLAANLASFGLPRRVLLGDLLRPSFPDGTFDAVLVDAPCSGTGTMGKNPEIRWRDLDEEIARQASRQKRLAAAAGRLVRPGGALVWSTCSLEPEENEEVVATLLGAGGWSVDPLPLPEGMVAVATVAPVPGGVRLLPGESHDGHTVIRLRRER